MKIILLLSAALLFLTACEQAVFNDIQGFQEDGGWTHGSQVSPKPEEPEPEEPEPEEPEPEEPEPEEPEPEEPEPEEPEPEEPEPEEPEPEEPEPEEPEPEEPEPEEPEPEEPEPEEPEPEEPEPEEPEPEEPEPEEPEPEEPEPEEPEPEEPEITVVNREWTFIVYMAADNDLESAAIADLNELEAVKLGGSISILALVDRNPAYDMTNGNWSDTRLFEIITDPNGLNSTIVSTRIDCPELGLSKETETELNTADPLVLSWLIDFAKRSYPAKHYALFVWGHGTGWRSRSFAETSRVTNKAVAFDDTQGQYMALPSFGRAVAGKGLSLIGFDTCYSAVLELAYQIRNEAELFVGSEGEILSNGWDYTSLFTDFLSKPNLTVNELGNSIQDQFAAQYASLSNATISQVRLREIESVFEKFDAFAGTVARAITGEPARRAVLNQVLHNVEGYHFTSFPSDLYIDILDFSKKISGISADIAPNNAGQASIAVAARELENALKRAILSSWAKNGTTQKLGVHVIPMQGIGVPASSHGLSYIRGSMAIDKSAFVENSLHWVPNAVPKNDSLLDKLFYWMY